MSEDEPPADLELQHEAARIVLDLINPESVILAREYGGYIYRNPDGSYSSTTPFSGSLTRIALPDRSEITPPDSVTTAIYHTHANLSNVENFSSLDFSWFAGQQTDGYLATPQGAFKYYDLSTDTVTTLGSVSN